MIARVKVNLSMFIRIDALDVEHLRHWEGSYLSSPASCVCCDPVRKCHHTTSGVRHPSTRCRRCVGASMEFVWGYQVSGHCTIPFSGIGTPDAKVIR